MRRTRNGGTPARICCVRIACPILVLLAALLAALTPGRVLGQSPDTDAPESEPAPEPRPGEASGIAVEDKSERRRQRWLWVPRVLLFPPRIVLDAAVHPVRMGLLVYERYELRSLFYRIFFTPDRVAGMYPIARLESGFGAYLGARLIHKSLFGSKERFGAEIGRGQRYGRIYAFGLDSGNRLPSGTKIVLRARYRANPADLFFGIGDGDRGPPRPRRDLLDPTGGVAVKTRFTSVQTQAELGVRHRLNAQWSGRIIHRWTFGHFGTAQYDSDDPTLERVFDVRSLVGYQEGLSNVYLGYRLDHDSRRWAPHVSSATPTAGGLVELEGGYVAGIQDDPSNHWRTRIDVQWFVHLFGGDRVIRLRAFLNGVWASDRAVTFFDLPDLGGPYYLRGYDRARFRDHVATLGTIEYIFPVDSHISGFLFVDTGRVWRRLEEFDPRTLRLGYGGGIELHDKRSFLARLQIASSIDGGIQLQLNFDPGYARKNR